MYVSNVLLAQRPFLFWSAGAALGAGSMVCVIVGSWSGLSPFLQSMLSFASGSACHHALLFLGVGMQHQPALYLTAVFGLPTQPCTRSGKTALGTLLHEGGHAAHFANVDQASPFFSQVPGRGVMCDVTYV